MRFKEAQQLGEKRRIADPVPQLIGPDSGQVEEPPRPTLRPKRCGKRSKSKRHRIFWQVIWYPGCHGLE